MRKMGWRLLQSPKLSFTFSTSATVWFWMNLILLRNAIKRAMKMAVTNEGLNHLFNVGFGGASQVNPWYVNLFSSNYTPLSADTAATFPASAGEVTTQITEGSRQAFVEAPSTAKVITNAANKAVFTAASSFTAYGAMLASVSTKGSTSGILFAAGKFPIAKPLEAGDQLVVTVEIVGTV